MKKSYERGFTLIEVLVALLVLSLGLIGVGFIQLKSLQSVSLSYHRSIATYAAQDAVERLWERLSINSGTCPDPSEIYNAWYSEWSKKLPRMIYDTNLIDNSAYACEYEIIVSWDDKRFSGEEDVSRLVFKSRIPGEP